ncbi:amidohydrolase family protein [Microbispora sp. ATCC PTA-5024]|uniref:amidohydrolase family protein n=1 Tax=Microbispora sp. ATCC PTA-5024 TaxID=316330 RepID=UPI0003DD4397|nr:amidohydrolase family protein [Microbispora sp. ATCC PTA-5024]ETK31931.1 amidohydrolase [Microbispora sp. ATCC PTA-5024]
MIDAHHHLWDTTRREYGWMAGDALAPIRRPYRLDDLRRETAAAGVTATVLVQTVGDEGETAEFLETAAGSDGLVAGVVGWVDLTAPDVAERLAKLRELPGGDRLAGVRHQVQDEPDPDWLSRPDVRRGLRAVEEAGLACDLLVLVPQLPAARAAVRETPGLRFVLDHAAKPPVASGRTDPWDAEIAALAASPNVACKLSGLVTEASWTDWETPHFTPYADRVLQSFGPGRVMFGSDWPVCELAASYGQVVGLARELVSGLSEAERARVFAGSAREWYGLS